MISLESALREVEPILRGGRSLQFSHPSFQEVLAARHFAEEIDSGRLSVEGAYYFCSGQIGSFGPNEKVRKDKIFRLVWAGHASLLNHIAVLLPKNKLTRLVEILSGDIVRCKNGLDYNSSLVFDSVVENSELCSMYMGLLNLNRPTGRMKEFLDMLLSFVTARADQPESLRFEFGLQKVADALAMTKSVYVAEKLVAYLKFCENTVSDDGNPNYVDDEIDFGYSIFGIDCILEQQGKDQQYENMNRSKNLAMKCLRGLAENGTKIPFYLPEVDYDSSEEDMWFVGRFGDKNCLKTLLDWMSDDFFVLPSCSELLAEEYHGYFGAVFEILRRHDFEPELVKNFNESISKVRSKSFAETYHDCLKEFSGKMFKTYNVNLRDHLQTKGIQFFDSEVYKPK